MHYHRLLGLLAALSCGRQTVAHPYPDYVQDRRHLLARQLPLSNVTGTRPSTSSQPPITPPPGLPVSQTLTTVAPSSSVPATTTISGGEIAIAIIGATYIAGIGGAVLMLGGVPHTLAAGTVVTVVGRGTNGDIPELETISDPPDRSQGPQTSDPAPQPTSAPATTTPTPTPTPTPSSSASPTSSSAASSSSAAAPTPYVVLFGQDATAEQITAVNSTLSRDAAPNSLSEVINDLTGLVLFFKAGLNPAQADAIGQRPGVSGVFVDETLGEQEPPSLSAPPSSASRNPTATGPPVSPKTNLPNPADISLQYGARPELKVISQPAGVALDDLPGFGYAEEAGRGVTIYVVDTGANTENPEWYGMPGTKSFLYTQGAEEEETDNNIHGSCSASKVAGPVYGTAKNANVVAVKMPVIPRMSSLFDAMAKIGNDVVQKKLQGKAVINISLGARNPTAHDQTPSKAFKMVVEALIERDVVIVTTSGNKRAEGFVKVDQYPARYAPDMDIVVVGAVDNNGYRTFFSQGSDNEVTVHAPGYVECADGHSMGNRTLVGTSFSAPAVAGVIATWLSQDEHKARLQVRGKVAANVIKMVKEMSYPRVRGEPPVIWNGIDPRGLACATNANPRRQAGPPDGSGSCQATSMRPSSTASVAPPTSAATSTAVPSKTAQPPPPAKPKWNEAPAGFTKAFEQDGVASAYYDATSDSASENIKDNFEDWCLAKCTGSCASVFLYRILQYNRERYNIYYTCNQYNQKWSADFVQHGITDVDSGIAFNKS